MSVFLMILLVVSGVTLIGSVLLMSPKGGGLGFGMAGASAGTGNYGSTKNVETRLKKIAFASSLVFVLVSVVMPYTL